MKLQTPPTRRMTPDEVFDLLRHFHVLYAGFDDQILTDMSGDTCVRDWFYWSDDLSPSWSSSAGTLNKRFGIDVPLREWKKILNPPRKRKLADVCAFVAKRAVVPDMPIPRLLGTPCRSAGAFYTVRDLLTTHGADTSRLTPSSPLGEYAANGMPEIGMDLIRMSPSLAARSALAYRNDGWYVLLGLLLLAATCLGGGVTSQSVWVGGLLMVLSFGGFLVVWRISLKRVEWPYRLDFVGLHDFRDLCRILGRAGEPISISEIRNACKALLSTGWRRYPPGHCQDCGYDLTGNVSGRCSECGKPTPYPIKTRIARR